MQVPGLSRKPVPPKPLPIVYIASGVDRKGRKRNDNSYYIFFTWFSLLS